MNLPDNPGNEDELAGLKILHPVIPYARKFVIIDEYHKKITVDRYGC